ncbi:MAG TPA: GspE/PulE family protein, partial [bacterium]|nr:GspE/PulE family protein [bacterium]
MDENWLEKVLALLKAKEGLREESLQVVLKEREKTGAPFGYLLIRFGLLSAERWYSFVLKELKIPSLQVKEMEVPREVLNCLPEFTCKKYQVLPVHKGGGSLVCALVDPADPQVLQELEKISGLKIEPRLAKESDLRETLDRLFAQGSLEIISPVARTGSSGQFVAPVAVREITESSAARIVEEIVSQAVEVRATDIHLEVEEEGLRTRFRINGLLYEFPPPPLELYSAVVSHIKVLANLDIAEKRVPQDGYFKIRLASRDVDLRVSTFPTIFGEMVALRVLDKANILSGLEQLGFLPEVLHRWRMLLDEPYGMLLVTGPTGSGKTTTLYSSLNELDSVHRKIMTVEDPVEYHLKNVDQTQINPKAGLTFAVALRSILRQDPNVVMIGEIRDLETASIAFRAAQTGQLVLSTLHTNTAPGAVIRLLDMGVESYLVSASLIGVLNQRLVRTICPQCKEFYQPSPEEVKELSAE